MENFVSGKEQGMFGTLRRYVRKERRGCIGKQWKSRMGKLWKAVPRHSVMHREWASKAD